MKNTREYYELLNDDKAQLAAKKFNIPSMSKYWERDWSDLHELRSTIKKGADRILTLTEEEKRDINEDEKLAFDYSMQAIDAINEDFTIREERGVKTPVDLSNKFHQGEYNSSKKITQKTLKRGRTYTDLFGETRDNDGFESFDEYLTVIKSGRYDARLEQAERRAWVEGSGIAGGYAVPTGFYEQIWNTAIEDSVVLGRAQAFPMERGNLIIPAFQNEDRETDGLFGGMIPAWLGENSAATPVTGKLRTVNLQAHKLALYSELSMEVISDAISLEEAVTAAITKSLSFYGDYYLLRGNGVAKPKGVLNDAALIKVTRHTVNTIKFADIYGMYAKLYGPCVKKAIWVISPSCVGQLIQMVDSGNHLVWTPSPVYGGAVAGPIPNSLFGLPVVISEKLPAMESEGSILLADFSNYAYGTAATMILEKSNAPKWSEGLISYRGIIRLDGTGLWSSPLTSLNGDELSWCVTLTA